jgi:hypothetical protein
MRQRIAAWILLLTGFTAMGLFPVTAHLCCGETECCNAPAAMEKTRSCCAPKEKKSCENTRDCCDEIAFFNLAPLFTEKTNVQQAPIVFVWTVTPSYEQQLRLGGLHNDITYSASKPPDIEKLRPYLACRRLLI